MAAPKKSNWKLLDYFLPLGLRLEDNALTDIRGGKKAVNNGAIRFHEGYGFNGGQWIASGYNPAIHGVNWKLNDAGIGAYSFSATDVENTEGMWGSTPDEHTRFYGNNDGNRYATINGGGFGFISRTGFGSKINYETHRSATEITIEVNGVPDTGASTPVAVTDAFESLFIGAVEENNGFPKNFFVGVLSAFHAGGGVDVNHIARYENIAEFLLRLGINITPDVNRTAGEDRAVDTLQHNTVSDEIIGQ
jgi:hypothetical protein